VVDFVSEVQEELRKDNYNKWLRQYGPYLLGLIVAIILVAAYMEWNRARQDSAARATSAAYLDAAETAEAGNIDAAIRRFIAIAEQAPRSYAGLSLMRAAGLEMDRGNEAAAILLLDQSAQKFEHARHKQLAQIKAAYILANQGRYDEIKSRLAPLAEKHQPYEFLARELLGFAAMQTGEMTLARQQLSYLETIPGVPQTIQGRAKQYLSLMNTGDKNSSDAALHGENTPGGTEDEN